MNVREYKKPKTNNERGSITIITLTTILFMLAFLISTYTITANRRQAHIETKRQTKEIYEKDINNIDKIYEDYFAEDDAVVPIYTAEQLLRVATNENIVSQNKIYACLGKSQYKLMGNIEFNVEDYISKYPDEFNEETNDWIDIEDKIDNGRLTGSFDYNGNTITENGVDGNEIIHGIQSAQSGT